ncbi:hypothetical protein [Sphingopyxis sp. USTB-05]|uniref:hypothetical protein n=1 Tax=Sphingopyxis sp. USTB-05 TaxID=2830667 RepID=UPI002078BECF|nr:hypothetical protein [Sphingopyxis sp. USTB-05]USI79095.1 hypothetical protein KEC45_09485 [Sphingopyxis sp. USTB-05]
MSSLAEQIMRNVLGRAATAEDYRQLNEMMSALPAEIATSPGAMYELVARMNFLQQLEATIAQAGREAQQKIHYDLPARIDDAALKAMLKVRDTLPVDATHTARKLYFTTALGTLVIGMLACGAGWVLGENHIKAERAATHAASDRELGRCVDAATGGFVTSARNGTRPVPIRNETIRNDLMICGAEYADRRAGNG